MSTSRIRCASGRRLRTALAALGASIALAFSVAVPANAMVDENSPVHQEPEHNPAIAGKVATQVYSLSVPFSDYVTDIFGGYTTEGSVVKFHTAKNDSSYTESTPQANQVWEFIPASDNSGGTIYSGYGSLRDRNSGKCLDIQGGSSATDLNPMVIWGCHGGLNQQWTATPNSSGSYDIKSEMSNFYLGRNVQNCSESSITSGTTPVLARIGASSCTTWNIARATYAFATKKVVLDDELKDPNSYSCLPGYYWRLLGYDVNGVRHVAHQNLTVSEAFPIGEFTFSGADGYPKVSGGLLSLPRYDPVYEPWNPDNTGNHGQVRLTCDPADL
ncbi:RICIN domain-containing protein [Streptomyces cinereoruber]|uniref:RICIN domain-containing protein n=1 Tax=Streptomyces cinereoruber TaxID=67260 RepID=UPI00364B70DF